MIADAEGRSFVFNGENKQAKIIKDNNLVGEYDYNGEGQRVRKRTYDANGYLQDTTVFVYSAGKLVAECSTAAPPENPTTRYTATDMLGSPRVITDSQGNVISRRDFKPFGEQLDPDVGGRSSVTAYQPTNDNVKQKFTGYQKDIETGLDFAEARMNSAVKIMANRFPIGGMDWGKFGEGANLVLASGGKLDMFVTSTGRGC